MRPVALVGFGPSRKGIYELPDMPIWSLSDAPNYDLPRIDRVFEMHPIKDLVLEGERWTRLQTLLPYPVYMLDEHEEVPSSEKYPLDQVVEECFSNIFLGSNTARYLDSSFPYMIALAVLEGYNPIYLLGIELRSDTEYKYQKVGVALMVGWASGKGVKIVFPKNSALLPDTLYGYDDYQHVSREELFEFHSMLKTKREEYLKLKKEASKKLIKDKSDENFDHFGFCFKRVAQSEGGLHVLKGLIEICNEKKLLSGEDIQTISRQNLEQTLHEMSNQESNWMGKLNTAHTRVVERGKFGADIKEVEDEREFAYEQMYMRSGAIHVISFLIRKLDRSNAEFEEFDDHYFLYEENKDG